MAEDDLTPAEPLSAPARASERRARFVRWLAPHLVPVMKAWLPPFLALLAAAAQHWAGKAETDKAIDVSYKTNAPVIQAHATELDDMKKAMSELADSVHVLQKLALSGQPGFNTVGVPVKVAAVPVGQRKRAHVVHVVVPPADPALVKTLQASEAKNQKLQVRLDAKAPPSPSVPPSLPAEVPPVPAAPPAVAPPSKPADQEWPPPVPAAAVQQGAAAP